MKGKMKYLACLLLTVFLLNGCSNPKNNNGLFQYKGAYVGDASNIGRILNKLPVTGYSKDFELKTQQEPFGIVLNYEGSESPSEQKEIIVYTATYLFTLVQNVDWIQYNFNGQKYKITKKELQNWYGKDLNTLNNEVQLNTMISSYLKDKNKLDILFPKQ